MTPPQISDADGWPFRLVARVPYRPDDYADWREGILDRLNQSEHESYHNGE